MLSQSLIKQFAMGNPGSGLREKIQTVDTIEGLERLKQELTSGDVVAQYLLNNTDWDAVEKRIAGGRAGRIEKLEKDLVDPKSDYYKNFSDQLRKQYGNLVSPDSMLAMSLATGGSYGGSQVIANKQAEAARGRIGSAVTDATQQQWMQNTGQAAGLMNMQNQNTQFYTQLAQQQKQYDEQNKGGGFFDNLLNAGAGMLGDWIGGGGLTSIFGSKKAGGATPNSSYSKPYGAI